MSWDDGFLQPFDILEGIDVMDEKTHDNKISEKTNKFPKMASSYKEAVRSMAGRPLIVGDLDLTVYKTAMQNTSPVWNFNSEVLTSPVVDDMRGELDSLKLRHNDALERIDILEKYAASIVQLTQRIEDLELELKIIK